MFFMGMNLEGSAFDNSRGRASVIAFPVSDWERGKGKELELLTCAILLIF